MREERWAALEALYRRTTPGTWAYDFAGLVVAKPDTAGHAGITVARMNEEDPALSDSIANGEWIADMHEAFDELLAAVRRLQADKAKLWAFVEEVEEMAERDSTADVLIQALRWEVSP